MKRLAALLGSSAVLAVAVLLVALNLAANLFYLRWDLSEGKVYSVSSATKRILKSLEDPVIVKAYFSRDLPQPYSTHRQYLQDLLRAYRNYGGRNFEYKFVQYPNDEDLRREALTAGVAPVQMTYIAKDKYEVKDGFMGMVILHGDKREVIPVIRDLNGLEYDLTSRIKKLGSKEPRALAVLKEKGAQRLPEELEEALRENYEMKDLRLAETLEPGRLPRSILVLGPRESFSDAELAKLEQMILGGTAAAFFVDSKSVDLADGSFFAKPLDTGLEKLFNQWGVGLKRALVLDLQNQNISIQQRAGAFVINNIISYPLIPIVTNLDEESPITRGLDHLAIPFISPVTTSAVQGLEINVLAASTRLSWSKSELATLSPMAQFTPEEKDPKGPFPLIVSVVGKFRALFSFPPASTAKEREGKAVQPSWMKESTDTSRVLVCGSSKILDPNAGNTPANQAFFLNAIDWLSQDVDLIAIRSKGIKIRPFTVNPGYGLRQVIKVMSLFLMPALVVLAGAIRWQMRRRWKKNQRLAYSV